MDELSRQLRGREGAVTVRAQAAVGAVVLLAIAIALFVVSRDDGGTIVRAEFTSASGLLEGNEVRVQGAPAGSVDRIELTKRNTALVTLRLKDGIEAPRRDATAAIRPVDLLGDNYVTLSPGDAAAPLRGTIKPAATSNAPRLSDLLSVFRPSVRRGLHALIVELGKGAERRGDDISRAAVALRPGIDATDELMRELGSQRASLRDLIEHAHRTTRQLAGRDRALGGLVDNLGTTLQTTADHGRALDATLEAAPGLLARLGRTSRGLSDTARAATPLARSLRSAAPGLSRATRDLPPFLEETERAIKPTRPLLRRLRDLLVDGQPTFTQLRSGLGTLHSVAPDLRSLVSALIPAAEPVSEGFFVNFADQGAEPGTQPLDPTADPARRYWRGAAVFSCESFGVKIAPNCLDQFLDSPTKKGATDRDARPEPAPARSEQAPAAVAPPPPTLRKLLPTLPGARQIVPKVLNPAAKALQNLADSLAPSPPARDDAAPDRNLLDFLLGP
jgi:virulence factor Mce-like protein